MNTTLYELDQGQSSSTTYNNFYGLLGNDSDLDEVSCLEPDSPLKLYRFVVNGIGINAMSVGGILGNVISMIILSRPQMRSSINYILTGLARVDTLLIITSIFLFGLPGIYPYTGSLFYYYFMVYPHLVPFLYPLAMIAQTASAYLTVMVSLDRYVAVCHPLRSRSICTYGRARFYVIGILVFAVLYNLPRFWEARIKSEWDPLNNVTIYCAIASPFRSTGMYVSVYIHWSYLIFMYLIPFTSLAVLNAAIYRQIIVQLDQVIKASNVFLQVRIANKERQMMSRLQRREIGLATMLLCVVIVFFLCNLLPLVINIIESFDIPIEPSWLDTMIRSSNLLVTINSSVNFIIYVIFGEKFKRLFLLLFCTHGMFPTTGRDSPDGGMHDDSFISNGERTSIRLLRHNTYNRNGGLSIRLNGSATVTGSLRSVGNKRGASMRTGRAPSPGPCVYYPANRTSATNSGSSGNSQQNGHNAEISTTAFTTQTSLPSASDWDNDDGNTVEQNGRH